MQARPFYFWCWNRIFLFFYVYIIQLKTIHNSYNLLKIVRTQSKVEKFSHFKSVNVLSIGSIAFHIRQPLALQNFLLVTIFYWAKFLQKMQNLKKSKK